MSNENEQCRRRSSGGYSSNSNCVVFKPRHFDMTLTKDDLAALQPGEWLTDDVIDFYFRFLKHKYFRNDKRYVYIPVNIANLLTKRPTDSNTEHTQDLANDANALDAETKCLQKPRNIKVAFLPIFWDGHWSLLIYRVRKSKQQEFLHYNSYLNSTQEQHTQCARTALINLLYVFKENDNAMKISRSSYQLTIKNCPQQNNGNDCGVFVCMFAYYISSGISKSLKAASQQSPFQSFVKRVSNTSSHSSRSSSRKNSQEDPDSDGESSLWKIKDHRTFYPDEMRDYILSVIYHECKESESAANL